jgi:regulator of protease activity HflC (stomatin/prohibitin superfamily)
MEKQEKTLIKWGIILVVGLIVLLFLNPFALIPAGHRGVVMNFGAVQDTILNEGLHWRTPIVQSVKKMDVQTQRLEVSTLAYSKDIQTVESQIVLNYALKAELTNKLYQEVGSDYESRLIDPAIQESVKSATAKFTAQELIEQRSKVRDEIKTQLFDRLAQYFIVSEFSITDFSFSDEYEKAVEAKQVAQQSALKAENDLQRVKTEAEQRVAQAMAEAEAIKIQAQAITQQGGRDYVNLKWTEKWNGVLPSYVMGTNVNALLNLPAEK